MNTWQERLTNNNDKRELLIESSEFTSKIKLSKGLKESLSMQSGKNGTLIVKNIPVTILDRENLNGRIYSTETMKQAILEAKDAMANKETLGQANEHPESSFVAPTDASHVIINAYIKENINIVVDGKKERHNVLFTDWEVLNTSHGKDLRALFEAECSFGTSIRGVGELNGKMVENYSFISVDGVGNPSSSTYTRMPVSESVKVEFKDANELKENYTVMSSSTNVVRDLSQAGILQQQLNANPYGTVTKTSTKVDQETDPKTGAQTSITTVEADTEDDVKDLAQAFAMAQKAMTNGISKVNSVTIEANEDEDEQGNKTESVDDGVNVGLEDYVPESSPAKEDYCRDEDYAVESTMTESKKEEPKDPNEGRQYVLKIKDNDPEMKEDTDNAPEFVAMKGNAIRFTKDPKKALHFTQGMEESGVVHCSSIKKLLADMGYGEQNLEKWYKRDNSEVAPKKEGIKGGLVGGTAGAVLGGAVAGPLGALGGAASGYSLGSNIGDDLSDEKEESAQLTEAGNTKYSATMEIKNGAGLPEMKSVDISSIDLDGAKKELGNHCDQQNSSSDGRHVEKAILVDNQSGEKYEYKTKTKELVPENGNQVQQQTQPIEEPKIMEPDDVELGVKEESADGEIKQNDKTLDMDIDDNTHVEKEFDTQAQASVAKAGIESGKLSGDVLLSDAVDDDWKICIVFDKLNYDDEESLYNNADSDSGQHVFSGFSDGKPDKIRVTLYPQEVGNADNWIEIFSLARNKLKDNLGVSGHPHVADFDVFDSNEQFEDGIQDLPESTKNDLKPGWYVAHDKIGISGPYETREACMEGLDGYEDQVSVYEVTENDLNEVLFKNPSEPSDAYVEKPLEEDNYNNVFTLRSPDKDKGYIQFEQIDDNKFKLTWYSNYPEDKDKEYTVYKSCKDTENLYNELRKNNWEGSNFHVINNFEQKRMEYENENLTFDDNSNVKTKVLYNPYDDMRVIFKLLDDGKIEVKSKSEKYDLDDISVKSYEDANNQWKDLKIRYKDIYTEEPQTVAAESVVESSLVPVRFSNIKWDEKDAAYRMFEDIEKDMQISHIEPDVNNANILVEYFENYMNDLNNVSVSYKVNPSNIKESANYQEEIIRLYNEDNNRQYPKIETADINLG